MRWALHGAVRGTVDIDLVIQISRVDFIRFENAMIELGLQSRLPVTAQQVFDFREEYIRERNLIAWSFLNPIKPTESVDVIITEDLRRMKTVSLKVHGRTVHVAAIQELIKMKKKSGRPQDFADAQALEEISKTSSSRKGKK